MKFFKQILTSIAVAAGLMFLQTGAAQTTDGVTTEASYTEGEVKRLDQSTGKITIKHGAIKNLDMPPMTMVFTVKEKSLLNGVEVGDQVRFKVVSDGTKLVITHLSK